METDIELLEMARKLDTEALVKIFDLYSVALYRYALSLSRDPLLADCIVGDVFANFLDQLTSGKGPKTNLRSYLYQAAYHRAIDEARYSRRRTSIEVLDWISGNVTSIVSGYENQILFGQIMDIMRSKLSDDQRHVVILRILEGFSIRETAQILGKKEEHVKVIQSRALAVLRRSLEYQRIKEQISYPEAKAASQAFGD